jgi:hypothetical protein
MAVMASPGRDAEVMRVVTGWLKALRWRRLAAMALGAAPNFCRS